MLRFLTAMVGVQEAEDCFQETFLAALRAYPELDHGQNLRGWLFTIAHRKGLDAQRRGASRPAPAGSPDEIEALHALTDAVGNAATSHVHGADNGTVWAAIAALPPKQRSAVTLRFAGDLTHREIGAALECSEAAARRNVHEAIRKLREQMA